MVVNSNTDAATTTKAAAVVRTRAPDFEAPYRTAAFDPFWIDGRCDAVISAHATLAAFPAAASQGASPTGGIVACFRDLGLAAVRELLDFTVVGLAEAAAHTACVLCGRFAVVTINDRVAPMFAELAQAYGLGPRLAPVETLRVELICGPDPVPAVASACKNIVLRHRAGAIAIGDTAFAGPAAPISTLCPVSVIGSVKAAVVMAPGHARLGARRARA